VRGVLVPALISSG